MYLLDWGERRTWLISCCVPKFLTPVSTELRSCKFKGLEYALDVFRLDTQKWLPKKIWVNASGNAQTRTTEMSNLAELETVRKLGLNPKQRASN